MKMADIYSIHFPLSSHVSKSEKYMFCKSKKYIRKRQKMPLGKIQKHNRIREIHVCT